MTGNAKVSVVQPEKNVEKKAEDNRIPGGRPVSDHPHAQLLCLQKTIGNRAVQRQLFMFNQNLSTGAGQGKKVGAVGSRTVQRFSAEPHEEMSAAALGGAGYSEDEMADIQIGNWATDMNQISLVVPYLQQYLGISLTPQEQFQLVQLLAVGHFGEQAASRMSRSRLGTYQPSEHFDNPAAPNAAPEQSAVVSHITTGIGTIEQNFTDAINAGRTPAGRQHYGRAMHITEDFFAHTNFVRIAMRLLDSSQPEPYGGTVAGGTDAGRYRLTSGIFDRVDTVMSILHLLIAEVTKEPEPGRTTSGDRIILMIVNHRSRALGSAFQAYLAARNAVSRAAGAVSDVAGNLIPPVAIYNQARDLARQTLETALNAAMAEAGRRVTGTGNQPSHTRMNIDDPASGGRLYPIARALAQHVVFLLDPVLRRAWGASDAQTRESVRQNLFRNLRTFLVHPEQNRWWEPIVRRYLRRR